MQRVEIIAKEEIQGISRDVVLNIKKFIEAIQIKKFPISVEKIDVKEKEYKKKFKYFEIKKEDLQKKLRERMNAGGKKKKMLEKQSLNTLNTKYGETPRKMNKTIAMEKTN